jgi:hypothetical protein
MKRKRGKDDRMIRIPHRHLAKEFERKDWLTPILHPDDLLTAHADVLKYEWGERWGNFLWRLRADPQVGIGAEAADRLIAASLFFLTRWSTIVVGCVALMLADQLLFAGIHRPVIWKIAKEGGLDLDEYSLSRHVASLTIYSQA